MKKVVIYSRVSTSDQYLEGFSIEAMEANCKEYVARQGGFQILRSYTDGGFSGSLPVSRRPALSQLLSDLETKKDFEVVLVWRFDRIFRDLRRLLDLNHTLTKAGVALQSVTERVDTSTAGGRAFFNMIGCFAEYEAGSCAERTLATMMAKVSSIHLGGKPPIGFKLVDKKLQIDNSTAPIVQTIFTEFIKLKNMTKVAENLNKKEIVTSYGKNWSHKKIGRILRNPVYIGHTVWNRRNARLGRLKPLEKWIVKERTHDHIIDEKKFKRVQKILRAGLVGT